MNITHQTPEEKNEAISVQNIKSKHMFWIINKIQKSF